MQQKGLSLPDEQWDELDELKREWDAAEADSVSRSDVAREAIALGLEALQTLDDIEDHSRTRALTTRDKRAIVRQGVLDQFRSGDGDIKD